MRIRLIALLLLCACSVICFGQPSKDWKVQDLQIKPVTEFIGLLKASIIGPGGVSRPDLSVEVPLASIVGHFLYEDKLVVFGLAKSSSTVNVVSLRDGKLVDWFSCYQVQQVSRSQVAYLEWYPRFQANTTPVVLLYDVAKSPAQNRVVAEKRLKLPPPLSVSPVRVGVPVFPQKNARLRSYSMNDNTVPLSVLPNTFFLSATNKFAFVAAEGKDFSSYHCFVFVVDLSGGPAKATVSRLALPMEQLPRLGENPNFVQVTKVEQGPDETLKLSVPKSDYGIDAITVQLPKS